MEFDKERYKVWKLPHPLLIHWVLNPGLAFNELILGQRIPKVMLIDKTSDAPLMERQYVPCPHCNALNDGRLWAKRNAFGHWFGYLCPQCHEKIPCLWNFTSIILLILTFPVWIWLKIFYEKRWLERQKARFTNTPDSELTKAKEIRWLRMGISYAIIMFCIMVAPRVLQQQLSLSEILIQGLIWLSAGVAFALVMKLYLNSKK